MPAIRVTCHVESDSIFFTARRGGGSRGNDSGVSRGVAGDWRRDARRLIGHPLAWQFHLPPRRSSSSRVLSYTLSCVSSRPPLVVVEANPVTPRRAHPETDDKVHPATPACLYRPFVLPTYARSSTRIYTRVRASARRNT